jgi:phosphate transport system substrate-binding protein
MKKIISTIGAISKNFALPAVWVAVSLFGASVSIHAQTQAQTLTGAGSSFAAPLYAAMLDKLGQKNQFAMNYASVGSSEGIKRITEKSVDFGASERPLSRKELSEHGLLQFPTAIGGVVLTANLPGVNVGQIKLDAQTLGDLYLGKIARWDDARLAALNPSIVFPKTAVKLVVREQGSGTSFLFSSYLSRVHTKWKESVGVTNHITAAGAVVAKGNGGVAQAIQSQTGSLGYVEYGYAQDNKLPSIQLKNNFGNYLTADPTSISAAVRGADWELLFMDVNPTFEINTIDVGCPNCWPITGLTYVIVSKRWDDATKAGAFTRFLEGMLADGDVVAKEENYVPLPSRAKNLVRITLHSQLQDGKGRRYKADNDTNEVYKRLLVLLTFDLITI